MARKPRAKKSKVEPESPAVAVEEPRAIGDILAERYPLPDAGHQLPAPTADVPFEPGSFVAALEEGRPRFGQVPPGFIPVKTDNAAGIRVTKKLWRDQDGNQRSTAALQFAENRKLSRNSENALVDHVEDQGFLFRDHARQWQRDSDPSQQTPGENILDALKLLDEVKQARGLEGHGR
ncbi:hypothetical protein [Tautonia plasticadhaerens]|uniref:Uncharacterized protein n=1 Tax=Tautonia plasticadhaerens TaxID=2527974 RepID=A0A518H2C8_9BACT|nr:hypothetical protein [Tautonia plasticadhaerens]QDV34988.1 hypothetical protein ElP_28850 [Tautonia plasticadhaerens]